MIENFCLGTRRLELFAPRGRVRKGWVGVGYEDLNVALSPRLTVTPDIAVVDQLEDKFTSGEHYAGISFS